MFSDSKKKYAAPTAFANIKDTTLALEKFLDVEQKHLNDAKTASLMKPMNIRFMADGSDRTLDDFTAYPKQCKVEGVNAQMTVQDLREVVAKQEGMYIEDVNFYVKSTIIPNEYRLGQCFADWMGFGLENWPPQFVVKPRIQGFEVEVTIPAVRDTSVWEGGKMTQFADRTLVFDVQPDSTAGDLKEMIFKKLKIPPKRQSLTAMIHESERSVYGTHVALDDDSKTMKDYGITTFCAKLVLEKNPFDENGMYIFDDAYWDDRGYHPQPLDCWIPNDSLANRSRPDANPVDPNFPTTILTDRRAADQARSQAEAKAKAKK
jgi:hypothetical protein